VADDYGREKVGCSEDPDKAYAWGWVGVMYLITAIIMGAVVMASLLIAVITAAMEETMGAIEISQKQAKTIAAARRQCVWRYSYYHYHYHFQLTRLAPSSGTAST